jgi:hypothetical protein
LRGWNPKKIPPPLEPETENKPMKKENKSIFKIDWGVPQQVIVKITPEDASKIISDHNQGNRFLRALGSKYISRQILNGEWIEDHPQPICFSANTLVDGQHRLAGIAMSKKSVWASVRFGVDPEMIKYMDTGISRSLCDRIAFVENANINKFISAMISQRYAMTVKGKPSPESALSLFFDMEDAYKTIAETRKTTRHLGTAIVGLAFADYHRRYGDEAVEMYGELFKTSTKSQPVQVLKNFLVTSKQRGSVQYPYIVAACLANHDGREVKVLRSATWR